MKPLLSLSGAGVLPSTGERDTSPLGGLPVVFPHGALAGGVRRVPPYSEGRSLTWEQMEVFFGQVALGPGIVTRSKAWENPHVRACVEATAMAIAGLPFAIYNGTDRAKKHWWLDFVEHPNDFVQLSEHDLKMQTVAIREVFGETFWFLDRVDSPTLSGKRGPIAAIWIYHPNAVTEVIDRATGQLLRWQFQWETERFTVDPLDVIHFKRYDPLKHNPRRPSRGTPPLDAAMLAISAHYAADRFNLDFFSRGIAPGIVLTSKEELSPGGEDKLREKLRAQNVGKNGEALIIDGGEVAVHQLSTSQRDSEFIAGKKMAMAEILEVYKVPPVVIGNQDAKYDNADAQLLVWWDGPLSSIMANLCAGVNHGLLRKEIGVKATLDTAGVEVLQKRKRERFTAASALHDKGVPWDVLSQTFDLGLSKFPGSDIAWVQFSSVPVEDVLNPEPDPEPVSDPIAPSPADDKNEEPPADDPERSVPIRVVLAGQPGPALIRAMDPLQVTRAAEDDELTRLILEIVRGDDEKLKKLARRFHVQAVEAGAKQVRELVTVETILTIDNPRVVRFLEEKANQIVSVNKTTADKIVKTVTAMVRDGVAHEDIAGQIKDLYNLRDSQARRIARQETGSALNGGRFLQMSEEEVQRHEWLTSRDARVRESHEKIDGEIVAIGEPFSNGLEFPQDPNGDPSETIGCRCLTLPATSSRGTRINRDEYWRRAIGNVRSIETTLGRKLQAYLYDQRRRVLGAIAERLQ